MLAQLALACSCGEPSIFAAGRCARYYRRHWLDRRLFNGQREAALIRDGDLLQAAEDAGFDLFLSLFLYQVLTQLWCNQDLTRLLASNYG